MDDENHHKRDKCRQASRNYNVFAKYLMTRQHREVQCPTPGMPHRLPTGAKASGRTVEGCSKACWEVGGRAGRKEALVGRDGKVVGGHQIESSSA